jgi:hypothetical protein
MIPNLMLHGLPEWVRKFRVYYLRPIVFVQLILVGNREGLPLCMIFRKTIEDVVQFMMVQERGIMVMRNQ